MKGTTVITDLMWAKGRLMIDFVCVCVCVCVCVQAFCDDITLQTIHTIVKDITATYEMEITVSSS